MSKVFGQAIRIVLVALSLAVRVVSVAGSASTDISKAKRLLGHPDFTYIQIGNDDGAFVGLGRLGDCHAKRSEFEWFIFPVGRTNLE